MRVHVVISGFSLIRLTLLTLTAKNSNLMSLWKHEEIALRFAYTAFLVFIMNTEKIKLYYLTKLQVFHFHAIPFRVQGLHWLHYNKSCTLIPHSEKFKMNRNGISILSENKSNLLLV